MDPNGPQTDPNGLQRTLTDPNKLQQTPMNPNGTKYICKIIIYICYLIFSLNRPTGPIWSLSRDVCLSVCLCQLLFLHFFKKHVITTI